MTCYFKCESCDAPFYAELHPGDQEHPDTDRQEINDAIDQAYPFFPFEAWDMIEHKRVTVVGRYDDHMYRLESGYLARIDSVTTAFPDWLTDAERKRADAKDQADTLSDAALGGTL